MTSRCQERSAAASRCLGRAPPLVPLSLARKQAAPLHAAGRGGCLPCNGRENVRHMASRQREQRESGQNDHPDRRAPPMIGEGREIAFIDAAVTDWRELRAAYRSDSRVIRPAVGTASARSPRTSRDAAASTPSTVSRKAALGQAARCRQPRGIDAGRSSGRSRLSALSGIAGYSALRTLTSGVLHAVWNSRIPATTRV